VVIEWRYLEGNYERLPDLMDDVVRLKPDLLMTRGGPATAAAKRATAAVPIVMWGITDPIGAGVVTSLARPGGNVTGLSDHQDPEIMGKRLQFLKEVAPGIANVAQLTRVQVPRLPQYEMAVEAGARSLGLTAKLWPVQASDDIDKVFTAMVKEGIQALDVSYTPVTWKHRRQIIDLASQHRLPAIYWHRAFALDGGLMAYGEDEREVPRRLAVYIDKILRGAKAADLPVEQPTRLELVINAGTAKALRVTIPPALLQRADEVIQ
jgi:putative ABC transport system substrate-binding protein